MLTLAHVWKVETSQLSMLPHNAAGDPNETWHSFKASHSLLWAVTDKARCQDGAETRLGLGVILPLSATVLGSGFLSRGIGT